MHLQQISVIRKETVALGGDMVTAVTTLSH